MEREVDGHRRDGNPEAPRRQRFESAAGAGRGPSHGLHETVNEPSSFRATVAAASAPASGARARAMPSPRRAAQRPPASTGDLRPRRTQHFEARPQPAPWGGVGQESSPQGERLLAHRIGGFVDEGFQGNRGRDGRRASGRRPVGRDGFGFEAEGGNRVDLAAGRGPSQLGFDVRVRGRPGRSPARGRISTPRSAPREERGPRLDRARPAVEAPGGVVRAQGEAAGPPRPQGDEPAHDFEENASARAEVASHLGPLDVDAPSGHAQGVGQGQAQPQRGGARRTDDEVPVFVEPGEGGRGFRGQEA